MKVQGLDDQQHTWNLTLYKRIRRGSKGHERARVVLKSLFPFDTIFEEVTLPGSGKYPLYADFYLNGPRLMVEVNGSQHSEFNSFHFDSKLDFKKAQARDRRKAEWCRINNIRLIVLEDSEDDDEWTAKIKQRKTEGIRDNTE